MFRRFFFIIALMLFPCGLMSQPQNPQNVFDQANQLLQAGKYVQALDHYQQLQEQKQLSGALFMNMGYAYMQLGKLGRTKFYFMKARQFDETGEKAEKGLEYVESQLSHQSIQLPPLPWDAALHWLQIAVGPVLLLGIGLILLNAGVFMYIGDWFRKRSSSVWVKIAIATAAFGILLLLLSFYLNYRQQRYSGAVMVTEQANVMSKPSAEATLVNKAYEGYSFTVDHKKSSGRENWLYVRMSNGKYGWIPAENIMIL